jgi:hypothetical protein
MKQHVDRLEQQPPLPHAAWKRLVQDVQVKAAVVRGRGTINRGYHYLVPFNTFGRVWTSLFARVQIGYIQKKKLQQFETYPRWWGLQRLFLAGIQ